MKYELNVTDKSGNLIEVVKGDDVDDVIRKAAKLSIKEFLGYYYEKERMMMSTCYELARTLTDGIKRKLDDELKIFDFKTYQHPDLSWEFLLNNFYDQNPQPVKSNPPAKPSLEKVPPQPNMNDPYYQYKFNLKDGIAAFRKKNVVEKLRAEFQKDYLIWEKKKDSFEARNNEKIREYEERMKAFEEDYAKQLGDWIEKKSEVADRARTFKEGYQNLKSFAVEKYCELVLLNTKFSNFQFNRKISVKYSEEFNTMNVEFLMPSINELSNIEEIAYSAQSEKFEELKFSQSEMNERYNRILYQIVLKSLYELYHLDKINALKKITFTGFSVSESEKVDSELLNQVISLTTTKDDFLKFNFEDSSKFAEYFNIDSGTLNSNQTLKKHGLIPLENSDYRRRIN